MCERVCADDRTVQIAAGRSRLKVRRGERRRQARGARHRHAARRNVSLPDPVKRPKRASTRAGAVFVSRKTGKALCGQGLAPLFDMPVPSHPDKPWGHACFTAMAIKDGQARGPR